MPTTDIDSTAVTEMETAVTDYSVDTETTDAAGEQDNTPWWNEDFPQWFGYYKEIPELRAAIDAKATWTVGKGYLAEEDVDLALKAIKGFGKDTFNTILENMIRTMLIGGDSFAEIIVDEYMNLINLKPLDPFSIGIEVNRQGMITGYLQRTKKKKGDHKRFHPNKILHLAYNRVADECHGQSVVRACENIILMRNEAMTDMKKVFHRYVKPFNVFHLDTDDTGEIAAFQAKIESMTDNTENIMIPKGAVEIERQSIPQFSTLNPLPWIDGLNDYFFQAVGVPQIIIGSAKFITEASAKISYLAFQQTIEEEQLFIEEQIRNQLGMEIMLEFPASLENELLSDKAKDGATNIQPNETTAETEGKQ